jgi:hypothetical protein
MRVTRKNNSTYDLQTERDSAQLTKQETQG